MNKIFEKIQQKAEELGVVVDFDENDIIDLEHLDVTWYYNRGCVASITKEVHNVRYELLIIPSGEIDIYGAINGKFVEFKNREVEELRTEYGFNDEKLEEYSISPDPENYLNWDNNNWFSATFAVNENIISTNDEVLDPDLLENMNDLEGLVKLLNYFIKEQIGG